MSDARLEKAGLAETATGVDTRHWRALAWLACAAILVHNTEELGTMAATYQRVRPLFERVGVPGAQDTSMVGFQVINVTVSLLAVGLTLAGTLRSAHRPDGRPLLPALVCATMLLNAFVPHIPAAIICGGYASGAVSAVLLLVPACGGLLWYLNRGQMIDKRMLVRLLAVGVGLIALILPLSLTVVGYIVRA